jgi:hypothetical protein
VQLAKKLAGLFIKNFAAYEVGVSAEVKAGGPVAPLNKRRALICFARCTLD